MAGSGAALMALIAISLAAAVAAMPRAGALGRISLPKGAADVTAVDTSSKNGGSHPGEEVVGYLQIKARADKKGAHLAEAAPSIDLHNATAAFQLTSNVATRATQIGPEIPTGQNLWTQLLFPYLGYANGPVLADTIPVYLIYYGNWTALQKNVTETFVKSMGKKSCYTKGQNSPKGWWDITANFYFDSLTNRVSSDVVLNKTLDDPYSRAPAGEAFNSLTPSDIRRILARAIATTTPGALPVNPGGAYFVLTSPDVYVEEFCANLCSYHSHVATHGTRLAYAFIGNPSAQCPQYCTYQYYGGQDWAGPNELGADAVVDQLAHTLTEIATNPFQGPHSPAGWAVAGSAIENADLCEFDYGAVRTDGPGGAARSYNMVAPGGMRFMVQRNFNRRNFSCVMMAAVPKTHC